MKYNTKPKQNLELFFSSNSDCCFNIKEIEKHLNKNTKKIGVTTLYRLTKELLKEGFITQSIIDKVVYYQFHVQNKHPHLHFQCDQCFKTYHLEESLSASIQELLEQEQLCLNMNHTNLKGTCKQCKKNI